MTAATEGADSDTLILAPSQRAAGDELSGLRKAALPVAQLTTQEASMVLAEPAPGKWNGWPMICPGSMGWTLPWSIERLTSHQRVQQSLPFVVQVAGRSRHENRVAGRPRPALLEWGHLMKICNASVGLRSRGARPRTSPFERASFCAGGSLE
jgi:hypothetical protein